MVDSHIATLAALPGTAYRKEFRLVGGTDADASALAKALRTRYGTSMPANVPVDPAIEKLAIRVGITIEWVIGMSRPDPRACHGFTRTPGAVTT